MAGLGEKALSRRWCEMILREGQNIRDVYEVDRFLGEGAFAEVYRVKHKFLGRQAMKVFKLTGISMAEVEEMLSEAVILSRINHPNIVRVFDAGIIETGKGPRGFFTMEYVAGGTLETFWRSYNNSYVPVSDTVEIVKQICRGLVQAHSEQPPIVHRDIKPQNILMGYDPSGLRVRVSDFGLAKKVNPMTLLASAHGTIGFKPPEVLTNVDSCAGDVWAIGTILYLMLTDKFPYPAGCLSDVLEGRCWNEKTLANASHFNPRAGSLLDQILRRALALKPVDRYASAGEMLDDLVKWEQEEIACPKQDKALEEGWENAPGKEQKPSKVSVRGILAEAKRLSMHPGKLNEAADLLEEIINLKPELRDRYEYQLKLWRRGVVM
jgi:serine/threonine-protein kinase